MHSDLSLQPGPPRPQPLTLSGTQGFKTLQPLKEGLTPTIPLSPQGPSSPGPSASEGPSHFIHENLGPELRGT